MKRQNGNPLGNKVVQKKTARQLHIRKNDDAWPAVAIAMKSKVKKLICWDSTAMCHLLLIRAKNDFYSIKKKKCH